MSRIFVKNLHKIITEDDIYECFSKIGPLTDVKLKFKDGKSSGFCFVGYEKSEDASKAIEYYNHSYLKQSKLEIEHSWDVLKEIPKLSKEKSIKSKIKPNLEKKSKNVEKLLDNPEFKEYLNINNKSIENPINNNNSPAKDESEVNSAEDDSSEKISKNVTVSDMDYLKSLKTTNSEDETELHTLKIIPLNEFIRKSEKSRYFTKKSIQEFLDPIKCQNISIPCDSPFVAYIGFQDEKQMKRALKKDRSFINGIQVKVINNEEDKKSKGSSYEAGKAPWSVAEQRLKETATPVAENGKIFVRNLWYQVTEELVKELFETIGPVAEVTVPICKQTRKSKGFAHVTFVFPEHAVLALDRLDGTSFKGRILHILPSIRKEDEEESESDSKKSFKQKKHKELKSSSSTWHNWNMLFLSSAAVIDVMSEKYGRSKQEILAGESDSQSTAVNLALGETEIVNETKRFLENEGVSLAAFENPAIQRSNTIILAKNLPAKTTAQEIQAIFGRYGELDRVVLPPFGVTAIISFLDSGEAKAAFRRLAYSKFKYSPLYLEWAPVDTLSTAKETSEPLESTENDLKEDRLSSKSDDKDSPLTSEETPDLIPDANTTIYVKNLSFDTTEDALKKHFLQCGPVYTVLIAKKRTLSQGFGFVQFYKQKGVLEALKRLQDSTLDGHNLSLKRSEKTLVNNTDAAAAKRKTQSRTPQEECTKILVKNIPFQATQREVRHLFKTFGELKRVHLPPKPDGKEHRGFGFVEFITITEAKAAFDSLGSSTHLYGRRLVLEWAREEESLDQLRAKTAENFLAQGPMKKRLRLDEEN